MKLPTNPIINLSIIFCLILTAISIVLTGQSLPNGYELSIYSNLPLLFYFALVFNIIIGSILVILSLTNKSAAKLWIWGYFLLMLNVFIIFNLPNIKGYELYGVADPITHLGTIKDILTYHTIGEDLFYPTLHILISSITLLTNASARIIMNYLAPVISLFFIISMYLLSTAIFKEKEKVILTSVLSIVPFVHSSYYVNLVPNGYSFMMVPLILYLYFKVENMKQWPYAILMVILLFLIPFSHPLTTLVLIVFFITIELSYFFLTRIRKDFEYTTSLTKPLILLTTFFTWISSFYMFTRSINSLLKWTKGELYPETDQIVSSFDKLNLNLFERVILFMKMYSVNAIMFFFSILAFFSILKKINDPNLDISEYRKLFAFSMCTLVSGILVLIFLVTGDPNFEPLRSINFTFLMTVPLTGYVIHEYLLKGQIFSKLKYKLNEPILTILIVFLFLSSILVVYQSPYIYTPNQQLSKSHLDGMEWFYEYRDKYKGICLSSASPGRFAVLIYGSYTAKNNRNISRYGWGVVADHFGYNENSTLGQNYNESRYFLFSSVEKLSYKKLWYELGRYSDEDYSKLDDDVTVNKIFSDGDVEIRFVRGTKINSTS